MNYDIIELMDKYSITLRKLPHFLVISRNLPEHPTKEEVDNMYILKGREMNEDEYNNLVKRGCLREYNSFLKDGFLMKKVVRIRNPKEGGWLAKVDKSHNATQSWNKKTDFFGDTPEEAVMKAAESIKEKDDDKYRGDEDAVLEIIKESLLKWGDNKEESLLEIKRYRNEFPGEPDYNIVEYGNLLAYYYDIRLFYNRNNYDITDMDNDDVWKIYKKHVGQAVKQLLNE